MDNLLQSIFGAAGPAPRVESWPSELVILHGLAEGALGVSSLIIAAAIIILVRRSRGMPRALRTITLLLGAFVFMGGVAHLANLFTVWFPVYSGAGILMLAAAGVAAAAALVLLRLLPSLAAIPSPEALKTANDRLRVEARSREEAYRELEETRQALERLVGERTRELAEVRALFEAATAGAEISVAAQSRDLRFTWVHNSWLGTPDLVLGRTDSDLIAEPAAGEVLANKRRAIESGERQTFEVEMPVREDMIWRRFDVSPLRDAAGEVTGIVSISTDVTRPKRLEAMRGDLSRRLAQTVQLFNLALRSSDIYVFSLNREFGEVWSNRPQNPVLPLIIGETDEDDTRQRQELRSLLRTAMEMKAARYAEVAIGKGETRSYYDLHVEPRIEGEGEVAGVVCAAVDISERKRNEQRMRLVMRELSHRSKNLLAVTQAIARQTAQQAASVPEFVEGFGQRLRSLASAQDLLVADNWVGADLDGLVRGQTDPYAPPNGERLSVSGPPVRLTPPATQTIALAIHELATNAAKHGAFSNTEGRVDVSWSVEPGPEGSVLEFVWQEVGGPPVAPPKRRGFGSIVVEFNVGRSLNAEVDLKFAPSGVRAAFRIPGHHLVDTPDLGTDPTAVPSNQHLGPQTLSHAAL